MSERFDGVVVAGAGPVGLVTALKIARAGIPVLVLDCEPDVIRLPRAVVYHAPTVEMLDRLGLLDELKVVGILKQDYQFRSVDGEVLAAPHMSVLTEQDTAYPFNLHMPQHELASAILRNFLTIAGAAARWNTRVTGVAQDAGGVTVTVDVDGDTQPIRCNWLIGADGGSSTVRRAAGLSFESPLKSRHKALLFGMYVAPAARGAGTGRRLVEAALALARARPGLRVVQLTVTQGNAAAQALYARCGFEVFGQEPMAVFVDGRFHAKVHMWRDLGG